MFYVYSKAVFTPIVSIGASVDAFELVQNPFGFYILQQ